MNITRQYILLLIYLDAFGTNSPLSSSANKHKVLGVYYSPISNLKVSSNRSTVQTVGLLYPKDVKEFGLQKCLVPSMTELKQLVNNGFFDEKSKTNLQVRVIASLGDNLEQHEVCGLVRNFSRAEHSCRKCLFSRTDLENCT